MDEQENQKHILNMICHTSIDCARSYIPQASLETLRDCLKEIEGREQSMTLRKRLEARIRRLEREGRKVSHA